MDAEKEALDLWNRGYNCSQSVLGAHAGILGWDLPKLLDLGRGFGAGLGRQGEVCGAVSGALMVLSLGNPWEQGPEGPHKEMVYRKVQEFSQEFTQAQNSLRCSDLLGCDLRTEAGQAKFSQEGLKEKVCTGCVALAVRLVRKYLTLGAWG